MWGNINLMIGCYYPSAAYCDSVFLVTASGRTTDIHFDIYGRFISYDGDFLSDTFRVPDAPYDTIDRFCSSVSAGNSNYLVVWSENMQDLYGKIVNYLKIEETNIKPCIIKINIFPNPFNSSTKISFSLPHGDFATVNITDLRGNIVKILVNNKIFHKNNIVLFWDGTDNYGNNLPSGIYFCIPKTENEVKTKIILMIK